MADEIEEVIPTPDTTRVFTIVNTATREISMSGQCSASLYDTIAPEGCVALPVIASAATHYFDGENLIAYTPAQMVAKAAVKGGGWKWSDEQMAWVDERPLDGVKDAKWAEMKMRRQEVIYGGFEWDGSVFDSDDKSQAVISGVALAAFVSGSQGLPYSKDWTLADNTVRHLTAADCISVARAMDAHITQAHETSRVLREAIFNAQTKAEVEQIEWPL